MTSARAATEVKASTRIPEIDGLRGLAIFLVIICHYVAYHVSSGGFISNALSFRIYSTLSATWSGVDLFFVLSGFLIGGILLDNCHATNYFKVFYVRRFCRILPLYFAWLLLFILLAYFIHLPLANNLYDLLFVKEVRLPFYFTFTQNLSVTLTGNLDNQWMGITWSLAVEEQFYLLLPLLIRFIPWRRLPYVLVGLIIFAPVLRIILFPITGYVGAYTLMPCRADSLMLGVLGAYLVRQPGFLDILRRFRVPLYGALAILLAGVAYISRYHGWLGDPFTARYGYSWFAMLYTCILLIAISERQGMVTWISRNWALRRLGLIAFGVYLFHSAINSLLHGFLLNQIPTIKYFSDVAVTLLSFTLTIVAAQLSWRYFEKPIVAFGHRQKYKAPVLPDLGEGVAM